MWYRSDDRMSISCTSGWISWIWTRNHGHPRVTNTSGTSKKQQKTTSNPLKTTISTKNWCLENENSFETCFLSIGHASFILGVGLRLHLAMLEKNILCTLALRLCPVAMPEWRYDMPVEQLETRMGNSFSLNFRSCRRSEFESLPNSSCFFSFFLNFGGWQEYFNETHCTHNVLRVVLFGAFRDRILQLAMNRLGNSVVWMFFFQVSSQIYKLTIYNMGVFWYLLMYIYIYIHVCVCVSSLEQCLYTSKSVDGSPPTGHARGKWFAQYSWTQQQVVATHESVYIFIYRNKLVKTMWSYEIPAMTVMSEIL